MKRLDLIIINRNRKGKSYEEIYGVEKAKEIKSKLSEVHKGKHHSQEWVKNATNARIGMGKEKSRINRLKWIKEHPEKFKEFQLKGSRTKGKVSIGFLSEIGKKGISVVHKKYKDKVVGWCKKARDSWTEESRKKQSNSIKQFYLRYPEKHPNRVLSKNGRISKAQRILFYEVKKVFPDAILEHPIKTPNGIRFADVGIPSINVDFEYDGSYWHRNKDDKKRDLELNSVGWKTYRILEGNKNWKEETKSYLAELAGL